MIEPFSSYPPWGTVPPRCLSGGNARTGYVLKLQQITGQTRCAYCEMDLTDTYEHWLMISHDHVIPRNAAKIVGIEWVDNLYNIVLCCSTCNTFLNRYRIPVPHTSRH